MDRLDAKVEGSKKKAKKTNARRTEWDEINGMGKQDRRKAILGDASIGLDTNDSEWEDEDDTDMPATNATTKAVNGITLPTAPTAIRLELPVRTGSVTETDHEADKIN